MDVRMIAHSGIGVRIQNILKYWKSMDHTEVYLFGNSKILNNHSLPDIQDIIEYNDPIYSIRELAGHPKMKDMDLIDIPHFNVSLNHLSKSVVTIHDLIPWVMKEFHSSVIKRTYLRFTLKPIFKRARRVIAVSHYTSEDIIREFGKPINGMDVIYNGIDHQLYKMQPKNKLDEFRKKYKLPGRYFLTVGIGKGHKNQEFLIRTLATDWEKLRVQSIETNTNRKTNRLPEELPPLLVAGTAGKVPDYLKDLYNIWKGKIYILPRIPDEEMPTLYQSALALLYPSLYEGFGFPVLEASAVGCPVISSNASVLPEILGDTGIYFDPRSESDLLEKIRFFLNRKKEDLEELQNNSIKRAQEFQWESSVEKLQKVYQDLLH